MNGKAAKLWEAALPVDWAEDPESVLDAAAVVVVAAVAVPVEVLPVADAVLDPEELELLLLPSSSLSTLATRAPPLTALGAEPLLPLAALW